VNEQIISFAFPTVEKTSYALDLCGNGKNNGLERAHEDAIKTALGLMRNLLLDVQVRVIAKRIHHAVGFVIISSMFFLSAFPNQGVKCKKVEETLVHVYTHFLMLTTTVSKRKSGRNAALCV